MKEILEIIRKHLLLRCRLTDALEDSASEIEALYEAKLKEEDVFSKMNCLVGYLERWRDNPMSIPPFELKDVINEAIEYLKQRNTLIRQKYVEWEFVGWLTDNPYFPGTFDKDYEYWLTQIKNK